MKLVETVFTYPHLNTPILQWKLAYYLKHFLISGFPSSLAFYFQGLPETSESNTQTNQRLPSTSSETRQLSLESLESEPEGGNIATVPAITVTEVSEESNEQNVPVSQAHPESLDTEVVELLDEGEELKEDETGDHEAEAKDRLVLNQLYFAVFDLS